MATGAIGASGQRAAGLVELEEEIEPEFVINQLLSGTGCLVLVLP